MKAAVIDADESSARELVPRLLDAAQIADLMGFKDKRQVYRLVHEGKFPQPTIDVGARYKRWRASDYAAWVEQQRVPSAPPKRR